MKRTLATISIGLFAGALACAAQAADIKVGAIYDYTGPFAGGGSKGFVSCFPACDPVPSMPHH